MTGVMSRGRLGQGHDKYTKHTVRVSAIEHSCFKVLVKVKAN